MHVFVTSLQPTDMELTFAYVDIKEVFETMKITIDDVYFGSKIESPTVISTYMYWIAPAHHFDYYREEIGFPHLSLQIKGKWVPQDEMDVDILIGKEIFDWLKTQKYVRCRYFVDGSGTGTIGACPTKEAHDSI